MSLITTSDFVTIMDNLCLWAYRARGVTGGTTGIGVSGTDDRAYAPLYDARDALLAVTDLVVVEALAKPMLDAITNADYRTHVLAVLAPIYARLNAHIAREQTAAISGFEAYLSYYNTGAGGPRNALMPMIWRDLYSILTGGSTPAASNLYFELLQGATYTNGLAKQVMGGAFTDGAAISSSNYSGGVPYVKYSSITGGPHSVTITVDGYDHATGLAVTSKTWTATIPDGTGEVACVAGTAPAGSFVRDVISISGAGSGTGTFYVESHRPAGRLEVPA